MNTQLCMFKPADWWDTGDDGNRLALTLCRACPARALCATGDPQPHGVIRAANAYSDTGKQLPICACGRPCTDYTGGAITPCATCRPPVVPIPNRTETRRRAVKLLIRAGMTDTEIGRELGIVRTAANKYRNQLAARGELPQPEQVAA